MVNSPVRDERAIERCPVVESIDRVCSWPGKELWVVPVVPAGAVVCGLAARLGPRAGISSTDQALLQGHEHVRADCGVCARSGDAGFEGVEGPAR